MPKFKKSFICDVCGKEIAYPNFRIEWGHNSQHSIEKANKFDFIQVCHEACSYGIKTNPPYPCTFGDIIFDQLPYSPEDTMNRLDELSQQNPNLSTKINQIKDNIFE